MMGKKLILFFTILTLSFGILFSIHVEYIGMMEDFLVLRIRSRNKVVFIKANDAIYPAEFMGMEKGKYIYKLKIPLGGIRGKYLKMMVYESPPSYEEIIVNLPQIERNKRARIPATLLVIGSDLFKKVIVERIGDEFSSVSFNALDGTTKYAMVFMEDVDLKMLTSIISRFSRRFSFFSFVGFSPSFEPVVLDLSSLPKNSSFIVLRDEVNLDKFLNLIVNADFDDDGWIEVEEIARIFDPLIYDDRMKFPVIRCRIFPLLDRNLALQKISILVMEGLLKPSDVQPCMENIENFTPPPWLVEYILGKLDVEDLKDLPKFLW